jgi:hypothetical protein
MFSKKISVVVATLTLGALISPHARAQFWVVPYPPRPLTPQEIRTLNAQGQFLANWGYGVGQAGYGVGQAGWGAGQAGWGAGQAAAGIGQGNRDVLEGQAKALDAQGGFLKSLEEAERMHEQVRQERLVTRRREIEQWMWERDHLPTLADNQERARRYQVLQAQKAPPVAEILSGKSLNNLLQDCQILQGKGFAGPAIPLDAAAVQHVNVRTVGSSGNPGLLRGARLAWPPLLAQDGFKADREHIEALMAHAKQQAGSPAVQDTTRELSDAVNKVEEQVTDLVSRTETVSPNEAIKARRFLKELRDTLAVLREPNARNYVTGAYTAQGNSADALVRYMTEHNLVFAPAANGTDDGYVAVHRALASYSAALQVAAGATLPDRSGLLSAAQ